MPTTCIFRTVSYSLFDYDVFKHSTRHIKPVFVQHFISCITLYPIISTFCIISSDRLQIYKNKHDQFRKPIVLNRFVFNVSEIQLLFLYVSIHWYPHFNSIIIIRFMPTCVLRYTNQYLR